MTEIWTLTPVICVHMCECICTRMKVFFLGGGEITGVPFFYFLNMVILY
jgi:hypothetical protein